MEAGSLLQACKGAVWRSCWWLEGLETATWMPSWLQRWISKANLNIGSTKFVSGSLHVGGNLRSYGQENLKLAKRLVKPLCFEGPRWPSIGPTWIYSMSLSHFMTRSWGHLWPSWARLGPFKPNLKPTWHPSCFLQTFKPPIRPPSSPFASFLKAPCLHQPAKNRDFP